MLLSMFVRTLAASHGDDVPQGDRKVTAAEDTETAHMDEDSGSDNAREHADDPRKADDTGLPISDVKNGGKLKSAAIRQDNG